MVRVGGQGERVKAEAELEEKDEGKGQVVLQVERFN